MTHQNLTAGNCFERKFCLQRVVLLFASSVHSVRKFCLQRAGMESLPHNEAMLLKLTKQIAKRTHVALPFIRC